MPPSLSLPSCTMQRLSVMIGEDAVWNRGQASGKSSLRHNTLPVPASRQETVPFTPSVNTLPFATAGELLGPPCCPASGPEIDFTAYLSCQSSLPVFASRHRVTSSPSCREKNVELAFHQGWRSIA